MESTVHSHANVVKKWILFNRYWWLVRVKERMFLVDLNFFFEKKYVIAIFESSIGDTKRYLNVREYFRFPLKKSKNILFLLVTNRTPSFDIIKMFNSLLAS